MMNEKVTQKIIHYLQGVLLGTEITEWISQQPLLDLPSNSSALLSERLLPLGLPLGGPHVDVP